MSWLVSLVLAGMMFTSESDFPIQTNINYIETNKTQVVRLDETERFEQTYPLSANGKISVSNVNGSITIEAWDRNEVKLVAVKTADTRENLADVKIEIAARPDSLRIETDYDALGGQRHGQSKRYEKLEVQYHLTVPRTAVLNEIETVNGSIIVSNMTNFTRISAVNGEVRASNLRGTANLSTVNGTVEADFSTLQTGSQISLSTVNGRANLLIPSDANATIKADSLNGSIINEFGLPVRKGQFVGRDLYGRVGSGDVKIKLNSVNGELSVRRKKDGKTVNPATNLLTQRPAQNSDEGATGAGSATATTTVRSKPRVKVNPALASGHTVIVDIPEINAEAQKAMAIAQKDLSKMKIPAIPTQELNKQIRESMAQQSAAMARMRDSTWFAGSPSIEKKSDAYAVRGVPKVTIDAKNCSVSVRGWDRQEVQYSLTKFSRSPNQAPLEAKVDHTDSQVNIKVDGSSNLPGNDKLFNGSSRVRIEVFVPKKSNLRIHTNGEIRLENVSGEIDLQGANEAVNVRDVDGRLSVGTADGRIRLIGFRGAFDGKTTGGMMNLEGEFKNFNALASCGTIVLNLPENANAVFDTNAEIEGEGLELIRENDDSKQWRMGRRGGQLYRIKVDTGKVIIRNAGEIDTVWN